MRNNLSFEKLEKVFCFYLMLSKKLGVKVKIPDDVMFIRSLFSNTGKWRIFDNGVELK